MVEVCFLIGRIGDAGDDVVLWADRSARPSALPDSRARWDAIWRHRGRLTAIAHTHPSGVLAFSAEDETTIAALDAALGRPLKYVVVTADGMLRREPDGSLGTERAEPWWADVIRAASGIKGNAGKGAGWPF